MEKDRKPPLESISSMSLLGRMVRIHILSATPILYGKPPFRWGLTIILIVLILVALSHLK
jgi:hypothetical protein